MCEGARARAPTPYCLFCANLREMCVMACSQSAHNETNKIIIKLYYDSQACFIPMNSICLCSFMCVFVCVGACFSASSVQMNNVLAQR